MKLQDKVAIVTGASSGMGREISLKFAEEGAKVLAVARRIDRLNALADDAKSFQGEIIPFAADVSDEKQIESMIDEACRLFGKLDILVNNAGIMDDMSSVLETDYKMFDRVMKINVYGPFMAMKKAMDIFLKQNEGVIINTASVGGLYGCRAGAAYTASKHAIVGLTKNTAFMYANQNIRCNAICPGAVETEIGSGEFMKNINQTGMARANAGMSSNPRSGKPSEIANVAVFLASSDSSFINGQCIVVDGGWTAY